MTTYYDKEKLEAAEKIVEKNEGVYLRKSELVVLSIQNKTIDISSIKQARKIYDTLKKLTASGKSLVDEDGNAVPAATLLEEIKDCDFVCRAWARFKPNVFEPGVKK